MSGTSTVRCTVLLQLGLNFFHGVDSIARDDYYVLQ